MADDVRIGIQVDTGPAERLNRTLRDTETRFTAVGQASVRTSNSTRRLSTTYQQQQGIIDRVVRANDRLVGSTGKLSRAQNTAVASSRRFRGSIQNVAFQAQDLAVQISSGTSAATALGQQLPQLLGGFGALGAVIGAVVAVGGGLVSVLLDTESASEEAAEAQENFQEVLDATRERTKEYRDELDKLNGTFIDMDVRNAIEQIETLREVVRQAQEEQVAERQRLQQTLQIPGTTLNPSLGEQSRTGAFGAPLSADPVGSLGAIQSLEEMGLARFLEVRAQYRLEAAEREAETEEWLAEQTRELREESKDLAIKWLGEAADARRKKAEEEADAAKKAAEARVKYAEEAAKREANTEEWLSEDTERIREERAENGLRIAREYREGVARQREAEAQLAMDLYEAQQKELEKYREAAEVITDGIGSSFEEMFFSISDGTKSASEAFKDMANSILQNIARIVIKENITGPLASGIGDLIENILGGSGFSMGSGIQNVTSSNIPMSGGSYGPANALGNVYNSDGLVPFANGGVVTRPTIFPFAKGTGLMGEAGPEAIMPLKRGSDGKLGVSGGGSQQININIVNENGGEVETQQNGTDITVLIRRVVAQDIGEGGNVYSAIRKTFNVQQGLTRRS